MSSAEEKIHQFMNVRNLVLTSIVSAMGFVVALFWRDVVISAIEQIVPRGEGLYYKFLAALIVTGIVVIVAYIIIHSEKVAKEALQKREQALKRKEERLKQKETVAKKRKGY